MTAIGPFTLAPLLVPKPWGGDAIAPMLGLPPQHGLGEAWLCADLASTAQSGAGGAAMISQIESGWGEGRSLHEVIVEQGERILGYAAPRFPLLLKVLDAARNLSVQVHPSPAYAARVPSAHLKTEAWYTLSTRPGGRFMVGLPSVQDAGALRMLTEREELPSALHAEAVEPGDAVFIPSGTVHALGAGTTVFEVQTASDTTFRLYDWSRETGLPARELHVEESIAATDLSLTPTWSRAAQRDATTLVFDTPAFGLHAIGSGELPLASLAAAGAPSRAVMLFTGDEGASLQLPAASYPLRMGRVTVVPAEAVQHATLRVPGTAEVLAVLLK